MLILGIETSCDETSLALLEAQGGLTHSTSSQLSQRSGGHAAGQAASLPRFKVLKNLVASQIKIHRPFGGVVPNLAKREHLINLPILYKKIEASLKSKFPPSLKSFGRAGKNQKSKLKQKLLPNTYYLSPIDMIAVTVGPGLEPALWTGIEFAKALGKELKVPVIGTNHLEGHIYSFLLSNHESKIVNLKSIYPAIALLVSGGHTILLLLKDLKTWKKLGETRDDAVGEAFDKVARILGLPYPGGPEIEKLARRGNPTAINFPRPMLAPSRSSTGMHQKNPVNPAKAGHGASYDFSFSGLKTSVLYYLRDNPKTNKADIAASFQQAAIDVLATKTLRAAREYGAKSILLCGGVAANKALRATLSRETKKLDTRFLAPDSQFNTDNAAMIAVAGYMSLLRKPRRPKGVGVPTATSGKYPLTARGDMNI